MAMLEIADELLDSGEGKLAHADAVAAILKSVGGSEAMQAASYLVYACEHLNRPQEVIAKAFGENFATLAVETTQLMRVQQQARVALANGADLRAAYIENESQPVPMTPVAKAALLKTLFTVSTFEP